MSKTNHLIKLSHLGLLRITGEGASKLLQGQLTCNINDITSTQSRLGAHCNPQGRIISLFRLFFYQNSYFLQMPREMISVAMQALKKYAVFFKVTLMDASDTLEQTGYIGEALPHLPHSIDVQLSCDEAIAVRLPGTKARYVFLGDSTAFIKDSALFSHAHDEWIAMDIAHSIPAIYPETRELFLPHEIHLPKLNAVSFNKGCYTGQEIIARIHYRGKLKTRLFQATVKTDLPLIRGSDIYSNQKMEGKIVDYAPVAAHQYALLIIAKEERNYPLFIDPTEQCALTFL